MKRNIFRTLFLLSFAVVLHQIPPAQAANESISFTDFQTLPVSAQSTPRIQTREMTLADFDRIFPFSAPLNQKCGIIGTEFGSSCCPTPYVGSGTLIGYNNATQEFEGITAKHNFILKRSCWFDSQANRATFYIAQNGDTNLGQVFISSFIQHPALDICLFYGTHDVEPVNLPTVSANFPQISAANAAVNQVFSMVHYPNGNNLQRSNNGNLSRVNAQNGFYYNTSTLGGSSGSPLFDNNRNILGIHVSGNPLDNIAISFANGNRKFSVANENQCILINQNIVNDLRLGQHTNL